MDSTIVFTASATVISKWKPRKRTTTKKHPDEAAAPNSFTMSSPKLHVIVILSFCTQTILADCPRLCECKWKNGKESVICLNANLSVVPLHLDAGTQVLDLTGNNVATIRHEEFSKAGLINLQKVYIAKCRLKTLERYSFKNLINLVELDLSYNVLSGIPSHTFDSVPELRELKLNGNPIQRIPDNAFMNLPQLVKLEMSDCKISTIEPRAFVGLEKLLDRLKLDKNKLTDVQASSFTILQSLHGLELADNPWNCSCSLRPLREWMLRQNVPFDVPPVCQHPKRLHQKSWDKLDLDEFACVPEIFAYDSRAHGIEGKNVTMTCRIAGIPEPNVRWLLKNKVIANLSGSPYSSGKKLYMVHLSNNSSDLTIFSADLQDAGTYVCAAENKAGKAEASVTLAVSKRPSDNSFTNKMLLASVLTGVAFVVVSCLISLCLCSVRKKQILRWRHHECRREDNYEKIEMNHKAVNANGGVGANREEIAVVAARKNGEYRVVPGGDTDQEAEEEEETNAGAAKKWSDSEEKEKSLEKNWNSPEHLLDPEDLHIPRRTLQETRDNVKKSRSSTCVRPAPAGCRQPPHPLHSSALLRRYGPSTSTHQYVTTCNKELSRVSEDAERQFPDLIEGSPTGRPSEGAGSGRILDNFSTGRFHGTTSRAASESSGSFSDINEIFCTLPRKKDLVHSSRYRSSDSQSPLLPESRYGSSGGESCLGSQESGFRRMSDSQKYSLTTNLNRNRVNKLSNSYLNLTREETVHSKEVPAELNATPLLDVSSLETRLLCNRRERDLISPTAAAAGTPNANAYNYHAAQLELFLEEYRCLQKQLTKMKETCDNLCQERGQPQNSPATPSSSDSAKNAPSVPSNPPSVAQFEPIAGGLGGL
ncbi:hypothetical protein NQ318_015733 [Aromia moschata]|uniref:Ig-like domain-containing protein n=1 Tax=Aromia moschata TaxID=1265417 RepID=A0AAV8XZM0_9CUCU|nr:hypothetical protein NQ318_015733 [Aromia moschata]